MAVLELLRRSTNRTENGPQPTSVDTKSAASCEPKSSGPTIFVVDDERVIAFTLSTILLQHGYRTLWFTDAASALEAAASDPPAVLITDYNMPSMSGLELALMMHSTCPECQILLISAQFGGSVIGTFSRVRLAELNVCAKPIRIEDLLKGISALLGS
jgi:DNA-binding NtrC family response regulator